jgi:hypothetical protein
VNNSSPRRPFAPVPGLTGDAPLRLGLQERPLALADESLGIDDQDADLRAPINGPGSLRQIEASGMRRLYEWEVRLVSRNRLSSCGVRDAPLRARGRMVDAIAAAPAGEAVRDSVTVVELALPHNYYEFFQTLIAGRTGPRRGDLLVCPLPGGEGPDVYRPIRSPAHGHGSSRNSAMTGDIKDFPMLPGRTESRPPT